MKKEKEQRFISSFNVEAREDDSKDMILEGYACVFGQRTLIGSEEWGFYETIDSKAFDGADMKDVPLKYNHSDNVPILARTRNKSLELTVDDKGLKIKAKLLDTQDSRDFYTKVKAGLLDKMSFAFTIKKDSWEKGKIPSRTVLKFDRIYDVAVVDLPAYDGTSIFARSLEMSDDIIRETLDSKDHAEGKTERQYQVYGLIHQYKK